MNDDDQIDEPPFIGCVPYTSEFQDMESSPDFRSHEQQCKVIEEYVAGNRVKGWHLLRPYQDDPKEAPLSSFEDLLEHNQYGIFNIVLVYSLAHFSRSLVQLLEMLNKVHQGGLSIVSVTEDFDTTFTDRTVEFRNASFERAVRDLIRGKK
jgi:site-specific DNA recombinase